jgi:hypothetical protein
MKKIRLRLLGCLLVPVSMPWLTVAQPYGGPGIPGVTRRVPMQPGPPGLGNATATAGSQGAQNPNAPAVAPVMPAPVIRPAPVYVPRPVDPEKYRASREQAAQKAVEFERQRAAQDFAWAQYALGLRYLTGDRVEKNLELAHQWLEKAAKNGERQAARKLAELDQRPNPDSQTVEARGETNPGAAQSK